VYYKSLGNHTSQLELRGQVQVIELTTDDASSLIVGF
jgi:hypothetical protein